jgi:hypothetical protein
MEHGTTLVKNKDVNDEQGSWKEVIKFSKASLKDLERIDLNPSALGCIWCVHVWFTSKQVSLTFWRYETPLYWFANYGILNILGLLGYIAITRFVDI